MPEVVSQVELRLAQPEDVANIADLLTRTFYQHPGWRSLLSPIFKLGLCYDLATRLQIPAPDKYQCWIAEIPHPTQANLKQLVGTVEVGLRSLSLASLFNPTQAYISNLAVDQDHRRQGIARQLIFKCEAAAQTWTRDDIFLHVRSDNAIALSLYEQLGYRLSSQRSPIDLSRQLMAKKI